MVLVCPSQPLQIWCFLWHIEWHVTGVETRIRRHSLWCFFHKLFDGSDMFLIMQYAEWRNVEAVALTYVPYHEHVWLAIGKHEALLAALWHPTYPFTVSWFACLSLQPWCCVWSSGLWSLWSTFLLDCIGLHWILRCSWILCGTLYYRTGKYSEFWEFRNLASKQVAHIQMMKGEDAVALEDLWNTLGDVFVFWREGFGVGISCFALPLYNAEFLGQRCADWAQLGWEMSNSWPEACTNCNANLPPGGASPILELIE